jgi:hypothetical protein
LPFSRVQFLSFWFSGINHLRFQGVIYGGF